MKKSTKALLGILIALGMLVFASRYYAARQALNFGSGTIRLLTVVGEEGFANTNKLRETYDREFEIYFIRVRRFSFLAADYRRRMDELKQGMIYLSEQSALPEGERFIKPPPPFKYLKLAPPADHSVNGIAEIAGDLCKDYMLHLPPVY